jgi:thiosulfate/3-mercaptopyruvate sulfurtransferase
VTLLDTRPGAAWAQGHFAGALDADLDKFLSTAGDAGFDPAPHGRHPLPPVDRWARQLGLWGIGPDTEVLVYDGARGAMGACRLWWMLKASGHERIDILDGGVEAGTAAGWSWTTDTGPAVVAQGPYPVTEWLWPTVDADEAAAFAADPGKLLVDVRSPERWRGEVEPLDPVAGHIAGSVNVWLERNLGPDGRFLGTAELKRLYDAVLEGRDPRSVAVHCGSGVSACHTLYALHRAGLPGARLYVGSYSQWCRTGRPVARSAGSP